MKGESIVFDVWLFFGSVSCGLECKLIACNANSITVRPLVTLSEDLAHARAFLDKIINFPSELLRIEIKLFQDGLGKRRVPFSLPLTVISERIPSISEKDGMLSELRLLQVKGATPSDESNWAQFVDWSAKSLLF